MLVSITEENYLKAIYLLNESNDGKGVSTNKLSGQLNNKAASVTDMLKRLAEKKLINYQKYKGVVLTAKGLKYAVKTIRKHRLWETFLVEKLKFKWDEVHEIAEQLEHIASDELIDRLEVFIGNPKFDPHGDPIPNAKGQFNSFRSKPLSHYKNKGNYLLTGVCEHSKSFLQHLTAIGLKIGDQIKVEELNQFDNSYKVLINKKNIRFFSNQVAANILVVLNK
ncbi:MAG: iron (metal) dependent repressor, DtxR family [Bacteroidetes bacterium]|nr:iron (metal) dependent repressor, DtxR family [Bacteroidota bacterium]